MRERSERSYGIIPLFFFEERPFLLLVRQKAGWWGFPKGHPEKGETPLEAAVRELKEETSLEIGEVVLKDSFLERYEFFWEGERIEKSVEYFLALIKNPRETSVDQREVVEAKWVPLEEAPALLTYPESQAIVQEVIHKLMRRKG